MDNNSSDARIAFPPLVKIYNGPNPVDADVFWSSHISVEIAAIHIREGGLSYGPDYVVWTPLASDYMDNAYERVMM